MGMKLLWFRKRYHCVNGHIFKNILVFNGSRICPKCAALTIYEKA
jgi:hypothetical protein